MPPLESVYEPTALHEAVEGQDTKSRLLVAVDAPDAFLGSFKGVGAQLLPSKVSIRRTAALWELVYPPTAAHILVDGHDGLPRKLVPPESAPDGRGASVANHELASAPCIRALAAQV